jgi:chemotaxis response regulator CheB
LSDWVVCGEVDNGQDAVSEVAKLRPDVILLDASIPVLHGVTVARTVKRDHPAVAVVMMSEQDTSVLALLADAAGTPHYIPKSQMGIDLIPLSSIFGERLQKPIGCTVRVTVVPSALGIHLRDCTQRLSSLNVRSVATFP